VDTSDVFAYEPRLAPRASMRRSKKSRADVAALLIIFSAMHKTPGVTWGAVKGVPQGRSS
jgi:hypothetical protein